MTAATWLEEHYPVDASETPKKKAISHSLRKWEGLRGDAILLHSLDAFPIQVDGDSCALCHHFSDLKEWLDEECEKCPLYKTLGHACDDAYTRVISPYRAWTHNGDPEPMIRALKRTLKKFPEKA